MALKRQLGDGDFQLQNKRRHLLSTIFKGMSGVRNLEEFVPKLEPFIRKLVKEEVSRAFDPYLSRSSDTQTESSGLRPLRLQFDSTLPATLFTNNRIVSEGNTPVKVSLYDPTCEEIVASGHYSSMKLGVVVLQGDFARDRGDDWPWEEFQSKVVQSREGKRPLLNGEVIVALKNGVGYISNVCFTDNSSWDRSGKFRLGVRAHTCSDAMSVREGVSNAFKVKDHRGESYQKQHPPSLNDEVWRLEKIAKDGPYHKKLSKLGISSVGDFLRSFAANQISLRAELRSISNKKWDAILAHAATCIIDDKRYMYRTAQGSVLFFDSVYNLIGVAFDGLTYRSVASLDVCQMRRVEDLKQQAYGNLNNLIICEADPNIGEVEMRINTHNPTLNAPPQKLQTQDGNSLFELGESSEMQGFNLTFTNSFGVTDSPAGFFMSPQDFAVDEEFQVESSVLKGNAPCFDCVPTFQRFLNIEHVEELDIGL